MVLFQSIDTFVAVVYYTFNKKYITEFFCINKAKPEMQCHGKCFLKANLVEQEDDKQKPIVNFESETIEWHYLTDDLTVETGLDKGVHIGYVSPFHIPDPFDFEVFRPPPFLI